MIIIRKADDRGHFNHGWLNTYHTFSFAQYQDPQFMGFRSLRVINEDRVQPGEGFGTHGHRDMEIISYPISGELAHRDSMGNGSVIRVGEIQYMSAGTGVTHSEYNYSKEEVAHFLQIWVIPDRKGYEPRYAQNQIPAQNSRNQLCLIASQSGAEGSIQIHQDIRLFTSALDPGKAVEYSLREGRYSWIQVVRGALSVNGVHLLTSDGAAISEESVLKIVGGKDGTELLLFDLN